MTSRANAQRISMKNPSTYRKEKVSTVNEKVEAKRSQNQRSTYSKKAEETNANTKKPQKKGQLLINGKQIRKSSSCHKRNHSQLEMSSSIFDVRNDDEFEQQIQNNQNALAPGVAIGRDGKSPVKPCFAKKKYRDMLTQFETTEIDDYEDVYFVGNSLSKKSANCQFDDANTKHYIAKVGDHIAYRYEVLSLLGKGVFGTVYKCTDHKTNEKVAVKVLVNTPRMAQQGQVEVDNLKLLETNENSSDKNQKDIDSTKIKKLKKFKRSSSIEIPNLNTCENEENVLVESKQNSRLKHVVKMIDNFTFRNHICIVTEILGESLRSFMFHGAKQKPNALRESQNVDPNTNQQKKQELKIDPLPAQMVKLIAYQIMEGLAAIHRKKVIHCDLKPENILFTIPSSDDSSKKSDEPKQNEFVNSRKDPNLFKLDYQTPKSIASRFTISFSAIDNFTLLSQIKIIDFGSSCRQGELIYNYVQSRFYRSPEVVLGSSYGPAIDVWSAGCIIAELFVGKPLFPAKNDTELLFMFIETLGNPPQSVVKMKADFPLKCSKKNQPQQNIFFNDDGKLSNVPIQPVPLKTRLTTFLQSSDTMMIDFLTKCLEWDKNKRTSAAKLLKHPWIAELARQKI